MQDPEHSRDTNLQNEPPNQKTDPKTNWAGLVPGWGSPGPGSPRQTCQREQHQLLSRTHEQKNCEYYRLSFHTVEGQAEEQNLSAKQKSVWDAPQLGFTLRETPTEASQGSTNTVSIHPTLTHPCLFLLPTGRPAQGLQTGR